MNVKLATWLAVLVFFILFVVFINKSITDLSYDKLNAEQEMPAIDNEQLSLNNSNSSFRTVITKEQSSEIENSNLLDNHNDIVFEGNQSKINVTSIEAKRDYILTKIPSEYHQAFQWSSELDKEFIAEYEQVIENNEVLPPNRDLETLIIDFIFKHELASLIEIEKATCNSLTCEIYGAELSSGIWSLIKEAAKNESWWPFTKEITRNAAVIDGRMHFVTLLKK